MIILDEYSSSKIADCLLKALSAACSGKLCVLSFMLRPVSQVHLISALKKDSQESNKNKWQLYVSFSKMFLQVEKKAGEYYPLQHAFGSSCEHICITVYKRQAGKYFETLTPIHPNPSNWFFHSNQLLLYHKTRCRAMDTKQRCLSHRAKVR